MKEIIVADVQGSGVLQVTIGGAAVGTPIQIPDGVTSVTVVVRDTEAVNAGKTKRAERRATRRAERGGGKEGRQQKRAGRLKRRGQTE